MKNTTKKNKITRSPNKQNVIIIALVLAVISAALFFRTKNLVPIKTKEFEKCLKNGDFKKVTFISNKNLVEISIKETKLNHEFHQNKLRNTKFSSSNNSGPHYVLKIPSIYVFHDIFTKIEDILPEDKRIGYETSERFDIASVILNWGSLLITIVFLIYLFGRIPGGAMGPFGMGQSKATLFDESKGEKITFDSVAGLREAKEELREIVEFLNKPEKFSELGGKIPKGALLVGKPGTGKTLLAKAVAGEAGVPFFSMSGSDFVEMFVGVGAARVKDLFNKAKAKAPCIIFIDEIDAIGRSRSKSTFGGANDERENTLNSLLVEMDGFETNSGVIILAATNRPEILDKALLRAGRFDRQIGIDVPSMKDREAIFKVHTKNIKINKNVVIKRLAEQTPGFVGSEIANICNEAALIAARSNKESIDMNDFQNAIDRVIGGLEKKDKIISKKEKEIVAYHEAGHAVAAWFLENAHPLVKVSIVPRGLFALGYAQYLPKEKYIEQYEESIDEICVLLGGRVAEEIIFGRLSSGALSDIERSTKIAYGMVSMLGMSKKLGHISYYNAENESGYFNKPFSEDTGKIIDEEVRNMISSCYKRTFELLQSKKSEVDAVAKELLNREVIYTKDLEKLIGKRPFPIIPEINPESLIEKDNGSMDDNTENNQSEQQDNGPINQKLNE